MGDRGNRGSRGHVVEEIARLQQLVRYLEAQQGRRSDEETETDPNVWEDQENPFAREYRWQPERQPRDLREQRSDPLWNLGIKIKVPEFDGMNDPNVFLDWLQIVERVFDLRDVPEDVKVKLVALKLRKYASLWWENMKKKRAQKRKP
uniref:Retrotransposon gag domain-containing protein n=1 Tax=Lactuca sativa TaxID=4236 RepID=A0A9R1W6S6_LACSA|nr:hypothetical protein LSAT_V11C300109970 [Lactuca sativa]